MVNFRIGQVVILLIFLWFTNLRHLEYEIEYVYHTTLQVNIDCSKQYYRQRLMEKSSASRHTKSSYISFRLIPILIFSVISNYPMIERSCMCFQNAYRGSMYIHI